MGARCNAEQSLSNSNFENWRLRRRLGRELSLVCVEVSLSCTRDAINSARRMSCTNLSFQRSLSLSPCVVHNRRSLFSRHTNKWQAKWQAHVRQAPSSSLSLSPAVPSHQQKNARRYGYLFSKKKSSTRYNSEMQLISSRRAYIDTQRDAIF